MYRSGPGATSMTSSVLIPQAKSDSKPKTFFDVKKVLQSIQGPAPENALKKSHSLPQPSEVAQW